MTIKRKKQIAMGALVAVTAIAVPVATVVSCGSKKSDAKKSGSKTQQGRKSIADRYKNVKFGKEGNDGKFVDAQKVKLVSFGDSVASAATQLDAGTDHRGHLDKNGKVTGMSYGSYMAKAFQSEGKLGDYNNFSLAGLVSGGMRHMIDPSYKMKPWEKSCLDRIYGAQDKQAPMLNSSPEEIKRFEQANIAKKIKEANLITMTIGADDILGLLKIGGQDLSGLLAGNKLNFKGDWISYEEKEFNDKIDGVVENIVGSINAIKAVNPDAHVVLTSYPMPVLQLNPLFSIIMKDGKSLSHAILDKLNEAPKIVAEKMANVDYVNVYDDEYWTEHALDLAPELFDIHPGALGYKAMAGIIIDKLDDTVDVVEQDPYALLTKKDSTHPILDGDYTAYIEKLYDLKVAKSTLEKHNKEIDDRAQPWKLAHFAAGLLQDLFPGQMVSNKPGAAQFVSNDANKSSTTINLTIQNGPAIIKALLKSAERGLTSGDAKVEAMIKKDAKFMIYKLLVIVEKKISTLNGMPYNKMAAQVKGLLGSVFKAAPTFTSTIWKDIETLANDTAHPKAFFDDMEKTLNDGPDKTKVDIAQPHRNLQGQII